MRRSEKLYMPAVVFHSRREEGIVASKKDVMCAAFNIVFDSCVLVVDGSEAQVPRASYTTPDRSDATEHLLNGAAAAGGTAHDGTASRRRLHDLAAT